MYFLALATDYDGTLAHDGVVAPNTVAAIRRLKNSGRRLILVTGRELLQRAFPELAHCDLILAENGALLYEPGTSRETLLAPAPPDAFVARYGSAYRRDQSGPPVRHLRRVLRLARPSRRRVEEHYVNLARDAAGLDADPCPLATDCVVSAITEHLAVLSSPGATEEERLEALKFLGHWAGDLHQPLHVSFEEDRGGNEVGVSGAFATGTCTRSRRRTDEERATWQGSSPIDWANESFAISVRAEVEYCVPTGAGCWYDVGNERLDEGEPEKIVVVDRSYIETNGPTVRGRLVKAGVRLGGC